MVRGGGCGFASITELSTCGCASQQPQRTEPCQCVIGQPWVYHGPLQGPLELLQCAAGVVEPALGAAAGQGKWFVGVAVLQVSVSFQLEEALLGNQSPQSPASV